MLNWGNVENNIINEIDFLKNNILTSPYAQNDPIKCNDCLYRLIAVLIVSGKIHVKKISCNNFFPLKSNPINGKKEHGSRWHNDKINEIAHYFNENNYDVNFEPSLNYGRADLSVGKINSYFEVGTMNLYKLYINLISLNKVKIYIVSDDSYMLEFYV